MSTYPCPKGHSSTEADFCSECGAKILGVSSSASAQPVMATAKPASSQMQNCPDCATPHDLNQGDFCEICGYNFVTGAHAELPMAIAPLETTTTQQERVESPPNPPAAPTQTVQWQVDVTVDPSLRHPDSPAAPEQAAIALPLNKNTHLIGRNSQLRAIHPDIALDFDDAVSHRHALLTIQTDGTLILRDIGSANGTKLNGKEIAAMVDLPVQAGDQITLGHWTRITISTISP